MLKIKLSYPFLDWPIIQQTPASKGIWDNCQFYINQDIEECNYWVIYYALLKAETVKCPRENTIFFAAESDVVKLYDPEFLAQFGTIVGSQRRLKHPRVIYSQAAFPWHVGRREKNNQNLCFSKTYDDLKAIPTFQKDKLISIISSNKAFTECHRIRLEFVKKIADYFGDKIDIFGRGIKHIEDKWDAIAPYKYHIAIENNLAPDYWTEKLSDAYLGGSYPFYYGCTNLKEYFSEDSFTFIDINKPEEPFRIIENCIRNNKYEESFEKILEARNLVLDKYNLFPFIADLVEKLEKRNSRKKDIITIIPEKVNINFIQSCLYKLTTLKNKLKNTIMTR